MTISIEGPICGPDQNRAGQHAAVVGGPSFRCKQAVVVNQVQRGINPGNRGDGASLSGKLPFIGAGGTTNLCLERATANAGYRTKGQGPAECDSLGLTVGQIDGALLYAGDSEVGRAVGLESPVGVGRGEMRRANSA